MRFSPSTRQTLAITVVMAIALVALLGIVTVRAQGPISQSPQTPVGTGFTYQGFLQKNNQSLSDVCSMKFSLWDSQSGGTGQLGSDQILNPVTVTNGVFSVLLNSGGQFGANAFDGNDRWLEVSVKCTGDGTILTLPRQQIVSVPYALQSLTVPDGSVTSRKMNATQAYYLNPNLGSTTATTPADLNDGTDEVTVTLEITQWVNIEYGVVSFSSGPSNKIHYVELGFDGAPDESGDTWVEKDTYGTMNGFYRKLLSAGTHTIALKYHVASASGATGSYFRRRLLVYSISQ